LVAETPEVLRASRALLGIVAVSTQRALEHVTLPQLRILVLLSSLGPRRVGALGELLEVVPSTVTRTVERLERGGWVTRTSGPEDRREVTVELTDTGRALVREVTEERASRIDRVLAAMTPDERGEVARALRRFSDVAGEPSGSDLSALGL
jgi:DNA-binding MarR family transcriptional regulator